MKIRKRVTALFSAVVMAVSMMSIGASAKTNSVFYFSLSGYGASSYTSPSTKLNYLSYSSITPTTGYLSSSEFLYATVCRVSNSEMITDSYKLTALNQTTKMFFTVVTPSHGTALKVLGNCGYYGVTVAGEWTP